MENTIEATWKEGFLNEKAAVVPKINDLYNQRSKLLIDRMKKMFRINLLGIIAMALVIPFMFYFIDALWQGLATAILLLALAWYSKRTVTGVKTINQGANSYEFLTSYRQWLEDVLQKSEKIMRFFYPINVLIAISMIFSAYSSQPELQEKLINRFPDLTYIDGIPLMAIIILGLLLLLSILFSRKIYRWDVGLVYGRVFTKLDETIAEMEKLRSE
ncbi:hypothetical protein [Marinilabilia rubra]|uniref:Uncharacterized protein n=1 Tax=Marinilabilia rubra TaxID=2162893 RepID=A0A2U2BEH0_9BACT|nr:hypothetical protein [Marinilabilia rubra]PWE01433.1 hypothetical protein DDZ16_02810 [Marinilabilia rubra]